MSLYVALEGPDGCGKSTQADLLASWLKSRGRDVVHLREPGSTGLGEGLRDILLDPKTGELSPLAEALMFSTARSEMIRDEVAPALAAGAVVVAERCYLSTWVYQGLACEREGVPLDFLRDLTAQVHGDVWPDRVLVLDVPYEIGSQRMQTRDRIEARGRPYHERVRAGYATLAAEDSRCLVIDASADPERVHEQVRADVLERLDGVSP